MLGCNPTGRGATPRGRTNLGGDMVIETGTAVLILLVIIIAILLFR